MNIAILIIAIFLLIEHLIIYYIDNVNNFFTIIGLLTIVVISSFNVFEIAIWLLILLLSLSLFLYTFKEELRRYRIVSDRAKKDKADYEEKKEIYYE